MCGHFVSADVSCFAAGTSVGLHFSTLLTIVMLLLGKIKFYFLYVLWYGYSHLRKATSNPSCQEVAEKFLYSPPLIYETPVQNVSSVPLLSKNMKIQMQLKFYC